MPRGLSAHLQRRKLSRVQHELLGVRELKRHCAVAAGLCMPRADRQPTERRARGQQLRLGGGGAGK
eukprot:scaffold42434_cov60-Phaeocystis_antarctica.AAC.2